MDAKGADRCGGPSRWGRCCFWPSFCGYGISPPGSLPCTTPDEAGHFVRHAVQFLESGTLQLDYFVNPPALTHRPGGRLRGDIRGRLWRGARRFENPGSVYLVARVVVALLGVVSVWVLYFVGRALFDRRWVAFRVGHSGSGISLGALVTLRHE